MSAGKQRLQEFEALRALAIVLLLILHSDVFSLQVFGVELGPISHFVGAFLLGSFFFLAGYFQEVSMQKPGHEPLAYIKSKFMRIFPPYWFALALFTFVMGYSLKRFDLTVYLLNIQFIFSPAFVKQMRSELREHGISIAQVVQRPGADTQIVVLTHEAREGGVLGALAVIDSLAVVTGPSRFLRIAG